MSPKKISYAQKKRTHPKITRQDWKLARHLQKIRKTCGLTQEELAEKIGSTTQWIAYLETAEKRPNLKMLYKIAKALNVKVKDLFPF